MLFKARNMLFTPRL